MLQYQLTKNVDMGWLYMIQILFLDYATITQTKKGEDYENYSNTSKRELS